MTLRPLNYGTLPKREYLHIVAKFEGWTETNPDELHAVMRQMLARGEMSRLAVLLQRLGFEWKKRADQVKQAKAYASPPGEYSLLAWCQRRKEARGEV